MGLGDDRQLVAALARNAVACAAPDEVPLFEATSAAYFADPERAVAGRDADDLLGFGTEAAVPIITIAALSVAREALRFVASEFGDALRQETSGVIRSLLARLFKRFRQTAPPAVMKVPPLTSAQLARVRDVAYQQARALDVPDGKAALVADAVVGGLALPARAP